MSKINNHGVGMNKINLAADCQEHTCEQAAAIQGGAEIILYEDINFGGKAVKVVGGGGDVANLPGDFNDKASSAKVLSGKWELATDGGNTGSLLILEPGDHPDFTAIFNGVFNDTISSTKVNIG